MEVIIMNFNQFDSQNIFNNNPSDTFKDLGKQVFNYFSSPTFPTNIYEIDNVLYIESELAGVNKEDIQIDFNNDVLTIQAVKHLKHPNENLTLDERKANQLYRQFDFENIDKNRITANFENGLLTMTLPKIQPNQDTSSSTTIPIS
ncbi:TPA: Hsp20 family protein [Staphylococcus argenteus]